MQYLVMKIGPETTGNTVNAGPDEFSIRSTDYCKTIHLSEDSAIAAAKEAATKNPGVGYAVFTPKHIYETGKPTFIEKAINDAGEMVLVK